MSEGRKSSTMMMIGHLIRVPANWLSRAEYCARFRQGFLLIAALGLTGQIVYDGHPLTVVALFPQWLLLGSIWYLWRQETNSNGNRAVGTPIFAVLIPGLSCLTLLIAWLGWKANASAICGVIPISDAGMYYISAQTFLRDGFLDTWAQRRPLNTLMTSFWLYLSGDHFNSFLLIQALWFSAAAFLGSAVVAALHGFRAGLLLFALLLVFAEPYLPTTLSETNGIICGILSLVGFLYGLHRRSLLCYWFGALFLATALAIRPSALLVLPSVVVAGAIVFGAGRTKRLVVIAALTSAVLIPSGISVLLDRGMSHHDGGFNANFSYTVYGLVSGGKGWEQFEKDHPGALAALKDAARSRVILEAARQRFTQRPLDLARGLIEAQVLGPLHTFAQIARLAFLGVAGDPLGIIPPAVSIVIFAGFAGVLCCQLIRRKRAASINGDVRRFFIWFLLGYLLSIPFFYKDGGLRLHAAILPVVAYILVWVLQPANAVQEDPLSNDHADRLLAGTTVVGFALLALMGWICLLHPRSHNFDLIPASNSLEQNKIMFWFKPGWPQCDLRNFEGPAGDNKPRWLSGAIPDDNYRSAGIREIAGHGNLYFGFDAGARQWKMIHTDRPVGLLNEVELANRSDYRDKKYRDFYAAESVQIIGSK
jgi:hypothetical protein